MSSNRIDSRLAIGLLLLLIVSPASAREFPDMQLFAPAEVRPYGSGPQANEGYFFIFNGMNWVISTPDVTSIGNPTDDTPLVFDVGNADIGWTLSNTHTTDPFHWKSTGGRRVDFGYVEGHHGWLFSGYNLSDQVQRFTANNVHMVFEDSPGWRFPQAPDFPPGNDSGGRLIGPVTEAAGDDDDDDDDDDDAELGPLRNLPVFFDRVTVTNRVEHWSLEMMCVHRLHPFHRGGVVELFGGVRYMQFEDLFSMDAIAIPSGAADAAAGDDDDDAAAGDDDDDAAAGDDDDDAAPGDDDDDAVEDVELTTEDRQRVILANSFWRNNAQNRIVGPQVGARWFKKHGRWMFTTEGRFFAGFNAQSIRQSGAIGTELNPIIEERGVGEPDLMLATNFNHAERMWEFSPAVELRVEGVYQLTKAVSFRTGWTGIWIDGIARSSNMVDYSLGVNSTMGILADRNDQDVFMYAWTIGLDINR